jgi:hypothetical protein
VISFLREAIGCSWEGVRETVAQIRSLRPVIRLDSAMINDRREDVRFRWEEVRFCWEDVRFRRGAIRETVAWIRSLPASIRACRGRVQRDRLHCFV